MVRLLVVKERREKKDKTETKIEAEVTYLTASHRMFVFPHPLIRFILSYNSQLGEFCQAAQCSSQDPGSLPIDLGRCRTTCG